MATAPKKPAESLLDELEKSLKALLADIDKDKKEKTERYTLTDKMKIFDRVLKHSMITMKIVDDSESSGFNDSDD